MNKIDVGQGIINLLTDDTSDWAGSFILDRRVKGLSPGTVTFYQKKLGNFLGYLSDQMVSNIGQLTPGIIRAYLGYLADTGHNPGGIHAHYRAVKTFLLWYEEEVEPANWRNPIRKVPAPKNHPPVIDPVPLADVSRLLDACHGRSFTDVRDTAIILLLLDTGVRASELVDLTLGDVDLVAGSLLIRHGKGDKTRMVYMVQRTRRALRKYITMRLPLGGLALWSDAEGDKLKLWGLHALIRRRASQAGIPRPGLHDFRRAFALGMLRSGADIYTIQRLMGHADLQVLRRYLAQTATDLSFVHGQHSPVDRL